MWCERLQYKIHSFSILLERVSYSDGESFCWLFNNLMNEFHCTGVRLGIPTEDLPSIVASATPSRSSVLLGSPTLPRAPRPEQLDTVICWTVAVAAQPEYRWRRARHSAVKNLLCHRVLILCSVFLFLGELSYRSPDLSMIIPNIPPRGNNSLLRVLT